MTDNTNDSEQNLDSPQDQLVAYLDGELDPGASREMERLLSEDAELRNRLAQYQAAWDLLDDVPRAEVGDAFTHTTVEMVAVSVGDDVEQLQQATVRRYRAQWAWAAGGTTLAGLAGFLLISTLLSVADRQLLEDLPIIENLDAYRYAESIDFLRSLEREGLFLGEAEDAP